MPTFEFTAPDGKTYEVEGPDGATEAQAFGILQQRLGGQQPKTPQDSISQIPGQAGAVQSAPGAPKSPSGIGDTLKGLGEVALSAGTGALAAPVGAIRGALGTLTSGKYGTQEGVREGEKQGSELAESLTYTPKTETGKEYGAKLGDFLKSAGLEALGGLGGETAALSSAAKAAKPLAGIAGRAVGQPLSKAGEAVGEAASAARGTVGRGIAEGLGVEPEAIKLAQRASAYGIPIRPDQLTNNKILKSMGEALEKVPLSGAKTEARQEAFNKALINQIGGDPKATKLNPEVYNKAMTKSGETIGDLGMKQGVKLETKNHIALNNLVEDAKKFQTEDVSKVVQNYVREINSKTKDGLLDGTAFRRLNSKIGAQARNTSNGDLKHALGELEDTLHDALKGSLTGDELKAYNQARKYYAQGKVLEPLVAKSMTGDISGPSLMGALTRDQAGKARVARGKAGELGELGRIGQLIKEPNSSGTAERGIAYGLLGGAGYANPATAAGVYGLANLYNRLGPRFIPKPPTGTP